MCQVLCISENTYSVGVNSIGDIVGFFEDSHVFTEKERGLFDIAKIPNVTIDELISTLKTPVVQTCEDNDGIEHRMWKNPDSDSWYKLNVDVKYLWTTAGLTEEEKAYLQSESISGEDKLATIAQFGNNLSYQAGNRTTRIKVLVVESDVE